MSRSVMGLVASLYSCARAPGTSLLFGAAEDCRGRAIAGLRLRVLTAATPLVTEVAPGPGTSDVFFGYCLRGRERPGERAGARVELWQVRRDGGRYTRVACEVVAPPPDGATIVRVRPTRADYPAGHPCR